MLYAFSIASCCCAAVPALLTLFNLSEYRVPPAAAEELPGVTVCIPARNEAAGIVACGQSVAASEGVALRVIVVDAHSTDGTGGIVAGLCQNDSRVNLLASAQLPPGWNGKQHACWQAANAADTPLLCFLDADVRLEPAALARMATLLRKGDGRKAAPRTALVSGFPLEETGTTLEWLLLPLIHFVLLGLLPMRFLRTTTLPGFAAGCGQFLLVQREAYFASGGHAAIRETMHDGLLLPRLLRRHGYGTRLADLTELARCRMYRSAQETWNGLAKNATEGMASRGAIVPFTLLLGFGQVFPVPILLIAWLRSSPALPWAAGAVVLSYLPRLFMLRRFRQKPIGAWLHPFGVAVLLTLQWYAFALKLMGRPAVWKARSYPAS